MDMFLVILLLLAPTWHVCESTPIVSPATDQDGAAANSLDLKGTKLMKDLVSNLEHSTTQANLIRSLSYSPKVPATCGEFNFSLAGLDEAVHILQAELHLWLTVHSSPQQEAYIVGIQSVHADGRVSRVTMRHIEVKSADSDGYVKFEVDQLLRDAVREGVSSILIRVNIYDSITSFMESNSCTCGCIQDVLFPHEGFTNDTIPTLIAFTHVLRAGRIDFRTFASRLALERNQHLQMDETAVNNKKRRSAQTCSRQSLFLSHTNQVFLEAIAARLGHSDFDLHYPEGPFDISTCGGSCESDVTTVSPSSDLVNARIDLQIITGRNFTCCVPVALTSYKVFVTAPQPVIVTIDNLVVRECACECSDTI